MNHTRSIYLLLLTCLFYTQAGLAIQYETVVPPTNFVTTGITNAGPSSDDGSLLVNIGFDFPFNGTTYNQLYINSNGTLSFDTSDGDYSADPLATNSPLQWILPFWHDLNPSASGSGNITYGTVGTSPNREFIAWWDKVYPYRWDYSYGQSICSFQVVLYEDGRIRYRYDPNNVNCSGPSSQNSLTVGVQENTSTYTQHVYNQTIDLNKDIVYAPFKPALTVTKTSEVISDPENNSSNPKRIPGSIVRYTITVDNANGSHAANVNVTDSLVPGVSWNSNLTVTSPFINNGVTKVLTDAVDGDEGSFDGSAITVNCTFITNDGPCVVTFDVSID